MDLDDARSAWRTHGYVVLPGFLSASALAPALQELEQVHPTPDGFHDRTDPRSERYQGDEFAGIASFPFASAELSLLAVHDRLVELAQCLLQDEHVRIYGAECWAKFTGAADYDQPLHRDYLNHTLLTPALDTTHQQVEMFVYLLDVPEELGPPHLVSTQHTRHLPAKPNWYPRTDTGGDPTGVVAPQGSPELYAAEVSAAGPAGTVVAFHPGTFHRGTELRAPRGTRYSMQVCYRPAAVEWGQRTGWASSSHEAGWYRFVGRATPRQLALFGFPPPGHTYWTSGSLAAAAQRYPDLDLGPWHDALA
ncbi:phytanoyl-CoA dioxygenase family protein [Streptacidiphilus jiangxiensis]|uniref:Phytanoyl-CoA dioxygenase (PhyH) n=1 Tax=Streptacidiphilus jiangxiensis TaxID=235985 RepID=A0A1H7HNU7_STRJI|nr:phytanoyl-CoA dioxygenase family protein [Streptacidiphilus jiangxiensis]SEK51971.1 Phytanoyl-CoA dioxygenase (PhyH) [Streptacidiphilus jiangxiensis]